MATRRSRIKGVLNIPARRKAGDSAKGDDLIKQDDAQINNNIDIPTSNEIHTVDKNLDTVADAASLKASSDSSECVRTVLSNLQASKTIPLDLAVSGINKLSGNIENVVRIDIEAPPSPTKINRTRIKAVPRLGQRRVSFSVGSASESEDDGRRQSSRHRNDSVCSLASNMDENRHQQATIAGKYMDTSAMDTSMTTGGGTVHAASPVKKEFNCVIQRKCRRTEQARKLATARRDFLHKFKGDKPPERHRLTMMDLIFYNPTNNPMPEDLDKGSPSKDEMEVSLKSNIEDADDAGRKTEEEVDDPDDQDEAIAPQVTVNADGEIIIDEKSLLIENKSTVKGRQKMERTHLVDGDKSTGYGIYKRVKRTKDWTKNETLRFYKALNTIGTDFTLMVKLFPNRTRRELKMKFKKEERINHTLIDKAVLEPVQFDMRDLEADLEKELLKEKELELRKKEVSEAKCVNKQQRLKKSLQRPSSDSVKLSKVGNETPKAKQVVNSVLEALDESDDENNTESEVEEDEDTDYRNLRRNVSQLNVGMKRPKRTPNSRHIFKKTKLSRVDSLGTQSEQSDNSKIQDDEESLEPGSLMIVSKPSKDPSKEAEYKIFMITSDRKKVPIDLSSDIVRNLAANAANDPLSEEREIILGIENNYTIDEEVNYTINEEEATTTCDIAPLLMSSESAEQIVIEDQVQNEGDILILPLD